MMTEQCFKISGRVQGVGFRRWAERQVANIGGLSGYIANMEDGSVLILLKGEPNALNLMLQNLYKGPLFARVDSIENTPQNKAYFPPLENGVFKRL